MKRFVYTFHEGKPPRGTCNIPYTVNIYQVKRDSHVHVASKTKNYVDEFQLVMMTLEQYKLLPKAAFERNESASYRHGTPDRLKEAGFAKIERLD